MDLRDYYLKNIHVSEYHHRFFEQIKNVNYTYNVFSGYEESEDYSFEIFDLEESIKKFKEICQPDISYNNENKVWFYTISYFLHREGYFIKQFPRLLARPPVEPYDFACKEIRNWIISEGEDDNGTVRYATRRKYVSKLTFESKKPNVILEDEINQKFIEISNRKASFNDMSIDEQLAEIANLIENMLKKNGKFLTLNYAEICFEYIDNSTVTGYRKKLHCFRHSTDEALNERKKYSENQKMFFVEYGLVIIKVIHSLL